MVGAVLVYTTGFLCADIVNAKKATAEQIEVGAVMSHDFLKKVRHFFFIRPTTACLVLATIRVVCYLCHHEQSERNKPSSARAGLWVLLVVAVTLPSQLPYPNHHMCIVL